MYESPIEVMFRDIENRIREQEENAITAEVSRQAEKKWAENGYIFIVIEDAE